MLCTQQTNLKSSTDPWEKTNILHSTPLLPFKGGKYQKQRKNCSLIYSNQASNDTAATKVFPFMACSMHEIIQQMPLNTLIEGLPNAQRISRSTVG